MSRARSGVATRPARSDLLVLAVALAVIGPAIAVMAWVTPLVWQPHWPSLKVIFWFVLIAPVLEEIVFRGGLQEWLLRRDARAFGPLSRANLLASLVFAGFHLVGHAPGWAAAMLLSSLVLGAVYERKRRLRGCLQNYCACHFEPVQCSKYSRVAHTLRFLRSAVSKLAALATFCKHPLAAPIALHALYNACFFGLLGADLLP